MSRASRLVCAACFLLCAACDRKEVLELYPNDASAAPDAEVPSPLTPNDASAALDAEVPSPLTPLVIRDNTNLGNTSTGDRLCTTGGDAIAYSVVALSETTIQLAEAPSPGCLEDGDEALLVNLQGRPGSRNNVGRFELVRVADVSAEVVTLAQPKAHFYGEGDTDDDIGTAADSHRVVLQRVPSYARLEVMAGATLSAGAWNGRSGGVLALRVAGEVIVEGSIRMDGRGYRGGVEIDPVESPGQQGESLEAVGNFDYAANLGGGGGGIADQTTTGCQQDGYPGGGGGHRTSGTTAETMDLCGGVGAGEGGAAYADPERLHMGSGGGSGGTDNVRTDNPPGGAGGAGGGIVWILADSITGSGVISANGAGGVGDPQDFECDGSTRFCYDHSGPGGGGAGGTVRLDAAVVAVAIVSASGGLGGNGADAVAGNGGDGGDGLVID